jgi:hypothetical protein
MLGTQRKTPRSVFRGAKGNGGIAPRMLSVVLGRDAGGWSRGGRTWERFIAQASCATMGTSPVAILWTAYIAMQT